MIIDTNKVITKENLTPEIRKVIVALYNDSSVIVQEDIWDHINNDNYDDAIWTIERLKEVWGDDPIYQEASSLLDRLTLLKDIIKED